MNPPTFHALGVPAPLVDVLDAAGITEPFDIQSAVIPDALDGADVIGRAPTGAGKTLAFGIPLVAGLGDALPMRPTALVLSPTRELAEQISNELAPLARAAGRRTVAVYGGVGYGKQVGALQRGVDLVVACPGRLEDLLASDSIELDDVEFVVVDEADRMADMGFLPAVERIVERTRSDRQTLLFSATLDGAVAKLSASIQHEPVRHEIGPAGPDVSSATHLFWSTESTERLDWTAAVAARVESVIVFSRTRHRADRLARQLGKVGVSAAAIHGGRSQNQRDKALGDFSAGRVRVLVATDVAARGVHVEGVGAVVHFDPPEDSATYIHRSGRTARAGASGVVVSMWTPETKKGVKTLLRETDIDGELVAPDPDVIGEVREFTAPVEKTSSKAKPSKTTAATRRRDGRADRSERTDRSRKGGDDRRRDGRRDRNGADGRRRDNDRSQARHPKQSRERGSERHRDGEETGTVISFHRNRGFGFIDAGRRDDVFVHHTNLRGKVRPGQRVRFTVREGKRGLEAVDVRAD